jgi:hypothetical protein
MQGFRIAALVLAPMSMLVAAPATAQLDFAEAMARRRPHSAELELEQLVTEALRVAAGGRARAAQGPTTSFEGGPRDGNAGRETDLSVQIEIPLLAARSERRALAETLPGAAVAMRAGARATADAELANAFVAAWLAQAIAELRQQDVAAVDLWLSAARRRAEAGADPPYEPTLVAGERDRALVERIEAAREVALSWGELKARSAVPGQPEPLALAGLPVVAGAGVQSAEASTSSTRSGIEARRRLTIALARAKTAASNSRWGLAGELAREGEEHLAQLGVAYRLPLRGEKAAIAAAQVAEEALAARHADLRLTEMEAQVAAAKAALASAGPLVATSDLDAAQAALVVRVEEGKERPSQVLPLRRQLLEARVAALKARAARIAAEATLFFLGEAKR